MKKKSPCWRGYTQVGMKMNDGKKFPNCVKKKKGKPANAKPKKKVSRKKYGGKSKPSTMKKGGKAKKTYKKK